MAIVCELLDTHCVILEVVGEYCEHTHCTDDTKSCYTKYPKQPETSILCFNYSADSFDRTFGAKLMPFILTEICYNLFFLIGYSRHYVQQQLPR